MPAWPRPLIEPAELAARRLGLPSVITMHGGDVYVNPEQGYDFPTRWYVRPPLRWTLRHADALTAITEDCRQHALRAGAPSDAIRLIFNGTDLRRFSPATQGNGSADRSWGPHMIFACRQLFPRKGIRFLIDAAARLKAACVDLAVLAGLNIAVVLLTLRQCDLTIAQIASVPLVPLIGFLVAINVGYLLSFNVVNGQTIGKMVFGLRVVGDSEDDAQPRPTPRQMSYRALLTVPSILLLGLGFLPGLVGEGRAVHDRLTHTRVVRE